MSHDLRTPLNAISGFTALTFDEADNADSVRENMKKMQAVNEYMLGLVEVILDASILQSTSLRLVPKPYPYSDFINGLTTMFTSQCKQKGISLSIVSPEIKPVILADKTRLNQITYNLLTNAINFTPSGGHVKLTVNIEKKQKNIVWLGLIIQDDGIGMSQEFQKKMFEPFAQENTAEASELRGTGLGLYITKNLVNLMGGAIKITSELGHGTTVKVHFSFETVKDKEDDIKHDQVNAIDSISVLQGKTILLVEDNPVNALITEKLLEKQNISVIKAKTGLEAIKLFSSSEPYSINAVLIRGGRMTDIPESLDEVNSTYRNIIDGIKYYFILTEEGRTYDENGKSK